MCIGLVVPQVQDVVFNPVVFNFTGTSVQASTCGWKKHV